MQVYSTNDIGLGNIEQGNISLTATFIDFGGDNFWRYPVSDPVTGNISYRKYGDDIFQFSWTTAHNVDLTSVFRRGRVSIPLDGKFLVTNVLEVTAQSRVMNDCLIQSEASVQSNVLWLDVAGHAPYVGAAIVGGTCNFRINLMFRGFLI